MYIVDIKQKNKNECRSVGSVPVGKEEKKSEVSKEDRKSENKEMMKKRVERT